MVGRRQEDRVMTTRRPANPAPGPLEGYCQQFDTLFSQLSQRESLRRYLEGLLVPQERNKTLTALANTEPVVGAQQPSAQSLQWFLSETTWDREALTERRVALLCADPLTAPTAQGVLVIDEHGDRLSLIHISEPTRLGMISYAVFCLKKK